MAKITITQLHSDQNCADLNLAQQKQISGAIYHRYTDDGPLGVEAYLPGYVNGDYNIALVEGNSGPYILISDAVPDAETKGPSSIAFRLDGRPLTGDRSDW